MLYDFNGKEYVNIVTVKKITIKEFVDTVKKVGYQGDY